MTTACARRGSSGRRAPPRGPPARAAPPGSPPPGSVIALHLVEQPVELGRGEPGQRAVVPFHCPGPEVEVDRADRSLDRAPQRPSVLARQAEQLGPGYLVAQRAAVVLAHEAVEGSIGQVALAPDVAELEAGIVIAGILVVDQPDVLAVIDEVRRQQIVVARHGALVADRERARRGVEVAHQVVIASRDSHAAVGGYGAVPALD